MSAAPADLVRRFGGLRVLVLGDAILDSYLDGDSTRLCREAPVPIVGISNRRDVPGGAANTAAGLQRGPSMATRVTGDRLLDLTGAQVAAVTLDTEGALVFERGRPAYRTYARPTAASRAAGAGDTFVAALTLALAAGGDMPAAAEVASAAASIVVGRDGTTTCPREQLEEFFTASGKTIDSVDRLAARAALYREQGRRIVFTNGCFDILHRGHITYLNRAKALGDLLVVGVNADDSVRRLKGDGRPINALEDRVQVLAALSCVDHIVPFQGDTPARLIEALRPDVFVKGGDYTLETIPEAKLVEALGGSVQLLPFVADRSTTGIIERIGRSLHGDGPGEPRRRAVAGGEGR